MTLIFNRIVELIGWVVLGVSLMLLVVAHHIDDYQTPEPDAKVQTGNCLLYTSDAADDLTTV